MYVKVPLVETKLIYAEPALTKSFPRPAFCLDEDSQKLMPRDQDEHLGVEYAIYRSIGAGSMKSAFAFFLFVPFLSSWSRPYDVKRLDVFRLRVLVDVFATSAYIP